VRAKAAGKYVANARGFIDKRLRTSPSAPPWACTCAAEQCQLEGVARHDWRFLIRSAALMASIRAMGEMNNLPHSQSA
jgi:hypothetical protein